MKKTLNELKIGFVGAGQMATAIGCGLTSAGLVQGKQILAVDLFPAALDNFMTKTGGDCADDIPSLVAACDIIFLAVKPQVIDEVLIEIGPTMTPDKLLVSIAAGITLRRLALPLPENSPIVRVMPNTPCLVGRGACGYCLGPSAAESDAKIVQQLLESVGVAFRVQESMLDAITGLSGSGPAFIYTIIDAMSDAGVRVGLPRPMSTTLAAQTVMGAAQMVLETGEHPGVLKDRVTSPGGTTIAGIQVLEESAVRAAMIAAVQTATERSIELGSM